MKDKDPASPRAWLLRSRGNLTLAEKGGCLKDILFEDSCFNDALKLAAGVVFWAEKIIK